MGSPVETLKTFQSSSRMIPINPEEFEDSVSGIIFIILWST